VPEGRIKWFNPQKHYGRIQFAQDREIFVHINQWQGPPGSWPQEGQQVKFHIGEDFKGREEAQDVRPVDLDRYRFLNPYNFVRYLDKPEQKPTTDSPEQLLMWRCPPPPHDRYVGLTGRITCTVEAKTPLFISDSHAVQEDKEGHTSYRFFQYDGEPALPASSLRGMVRSVFEAVTNSCFPVFDDRRLEFRERPEYGNKVKGGAGIVNRLPDSDNDGEIVLCHTAKVGAYYEGDDQWKNVLGQKLAGQPWKCGDWAVARAKRLRQGYVVRELPTAEEKLQPLDDGEEYIQGWLKITGKGEGTSKKSEFLFLNPDKHGCPGALPFGADEMEEYNFVISGQRERGELPESPQSPKLSVGDLVWVEVEEEGEYGRARRIVRVQVPRIPYNHTISELLPDFLHRCKNYNALCPACRVFGWVWDSPPEDADRVAYAGRVRLSHGRPVEGTLEYADEMSLAILSAPKPTTTPFYLLDANGHPDAQVDYDTPNAQLRGRKFYRHHGEANPDEYQVSDKSDQNRTVRDALKPSAQFTFTLEFENLVEVELGALLYALELEDDLVHRLGYAKPLGFGSVKVEVIEMEVLDLVSRYTALQPTDGSWKSVDAQKRGEWTTAFKQAMAQVYGKDFDDLDNIQDLRALLGEPPDDLLIHYPRSTSRFDPDHPQYEWFVGNKKRVEDQKQPEYKRKLPDPVVPDLASEDEQGLPLIDKDGEKGQ
jgi:CRISPR-associated protein (TIGR03986 family)